MACDDGEAICIYVKKRDDGKGNCQGHRDEFISCNANCPSGDTKIGGWKNWLWNVKDWNGIPTCGSLGEHCIPKDTKVILVDNIEKAVQDIKIGDKLKGLVGANTVLEIEAGKSGNRTLYSINDGQFMITEGHPLLTQNGWTAVDWETVSKYHGRDDWSKEKLVIGDLLMGKGQPIRVISIKKTKARDATTYNFKLDNDNTFIANGVVVQGYDSVAISYRNPHQSLVNDTKKGN
jgi:hypothetical protein